MGNEVEGRITISCVATGSQCKHMAKRKNRTWLYSCVCRAFTLTSGRNARYCNTALSLAVDYVLRPSDPLLWIAPGQVEVDREEVEAGLICQTDSAVQEEEKPVE